MRHYVALAVASCLLASPTVAAPFFTGLGDLPGGGISSTATVVSGDGSVVYGYSAAGDPSFGASAFRWTRESGIVELEIGIAGWAAWVAPSATNHDGSVMVGDSPNPNGSGFVWTAAQGTQELSRIYPYYYRSPLALS